MLIYFGSKIALRIIYDTDQTEYCKMYIFKLNKTAVLHSLKGNIITYAK